MEIRGIDISQYQGSAFNLQKAKAEGYNFVIIRIGGFVNNTFIKDKYFEDNYVNAVENNFDIGAYFYFNDSDIDNFYTDVITSTINTQLKNKQFSYPIFIDYESENCKHNSKVHNNYIITSILEKLENTGYCVGYYTYEYFAKTYLDEKSLSQRFIQWIARYSPSKPTVNYMIWQYGGETNYLNTNQVAGVTCDQNFSYVDFPSLIKAQGRNGFTSDYDINNDGLFNSKDIVSLMRHLANNETTDKTDINKDGTFNSKDLIALMKKLSEK